jgi:hypothetical protein
MDSWSDIVYSYKKGNNSSRIIISSKVHPIEKIYLPVRSHIIESPFGLVLYYDNLLWHAFKCFGVG